MQSQLTSTLLNDKEAEREMSVKWEVSLLSW